jgi:hypothetical protein
VNKAVLPAGPVEAGSSGAAGLRRREGGDGA